MKKINHKIRKKPTKKYRVFQHTISKTLGIVIGVGICVCGLAILIYLAAVGHDKFLSSRFENPPSYSKDNIWGGLSVNIVIDKKVVKEPVADKIRDCNSPAEKISTDFSSRFPDLGVPPCVQGEKYGGYSGSVYLEGTINVKSDLWLETKIIPVNLLTLNHSGRQVKPKLEKNIFGLYLNKGQGTSSKFTFDETYDAKDFKLYLNDGVKSALILGDTFEPEHK